MKCDPVGLQSGINVYQYARSNPTRFVDPSGLADKEAKEALEVTIPFIKKLQERGLKWAREVPFVIEQNGKKIVGRFDLVYQDPSNGRLIPVEAKRLPGSAQTAAQIEYLPLLEKGAAATITGPAQGGGNLSVTGGTTVTGGVVVINKSNFGAVADTQLAGHPVGKQYYEFSTVSAEGKREYRAFDTPEELLQFNKERLAAPVTPGSVKSATPGAVPQGEPASSGVVANPAEGAKPGVFRKISGKLSTLKAIAPVAILAGAQYLAQKNFDEAAELRRSYTGVPTPEQIERQGQAGWVFSGQLDESNRPVWNFQPSVLQRLRDAVFWAADPFGYHRPGVDREPGVITDA